MTTTKTVCIIKDRSHFWPKIEEFLKGAGANIKPLRSEETILSESECDLLIGTEGILRLSLPRGVPKLIISSKKADRAWSRDIEYMVWPVAEDAFLEMTSRLLHLSQRRRFKTVITIKVPKEDMPIVGRSEDFSTTGLSFKVDRELRKNDNIAVSFHIPDIDKRLTLDAEIMRVGIDPADGSRYYGAKFIGLDDSEKEALQRFVGRR